MSRLDEMKCEACRKGAPRLTPDEIGSMQKEVPDWRVEEAEGIARLTRTFRFDDFRSALDFTNQVGAIAEEEDHHPALLTEWGRVRVEWWTHKIRGLHRNDFIMAAKTDRLFGPGRGE